MSKASDKDEILEFLRDRDPDEPVKNFTNDEVVRSIWVLLNIYKRELLHEGYIEISKQQENAIMVVTVETASITDSGVAFINNGGYTKKDAEEQLEKSRRNREYWASMTIVLTTILTAIFTGLTWRDTHNALPKKNEPIQKQKTVDSLSLIRQKTDTISKAKSMLRATPKK